MAVNKTYKNRTIGDRGKILKRRLFMLQGASRFLEKLSLNDIVLLLLASLFLGQLEFFADDPGLGWHIKSGQYISHYKSLPYIDPFLASTYPRFWVCDQWFSDYIFYGLFAAGSWGFLYSAAIFTFFYVFLYYSYYSVCKLGGAPLAALIAVFLAIKMAQVHFILRPVIFSFFLFSFVYFQILKISLSGEVKRFDKISLPLSFLFWANLHPSFLLGIFVLAIFNLRAVLFPLEDAKIGQLSFLTCVCFLVTFINPFSFYLHESIISLGLSNYFMNLNTEWQPISLVSNEGHFFFISIIIVAGVGLLRERSLGFLLRFDILMFIIFAALTLKSVRFLPYFSICSLFPITNCISAIGESGFFAKFAEFKKMLQRVNKREGKSAHGAFGFCILILIVLSSLFDGRGIPFGPLDLGPASSRFPYQAMHKLNIIAESSSKVLVLSDPNWGGFVTLQSTDHDFINMIKPLIDDRNYLLGEGFYREFFARMQPERQIKENILFFGPTHLLLSIHSRLAEYLVLNNIFPVIQKDNVSYLFEVVS